ncbi:MAG: hypothetical protein CBC29_05580 [Methylococcaceae bacterium TMED69]|nr:MAG: hypothetical protein CBC29_05580 [Methylococcaceae bacterium TMED69]
MATFANTSSPTPFAVFDSDTQFIAEADRMVTFVKRKLGDDILSVELTKKQVWACFEESVFEYSKYINEYQAKSQLANLLGTSTGSNATSGPKGVENKFPRETLEFLTRKAEPYAAHAGLGGLWNTYSGSIELEVSRQDYDIYTEMKDADDNVVFANLAEGSRGKLRIFEVYHFSPQAAYRFFDTTSAINYLNNEFAFESFTPETVFYVLPVFEDVLRAGQMDISNRVRRSNYSYQITGTKLRIFPKPATSGSLWINYGLPMDGMNPSVADDSIHGVASLSNVPFDNLEYGTINSMGRQWIRQYTLAGAKEVLGLIRSKFGSVPIPSGDLQLNGSDLLSQGQNEKEKLRTELKEMLESLTYDKLIEGEATEAENVQRLLKTIPIPLGKAIVIG